MTDHDLATLVREHVAQDEPPFRMSSDTVIALGRRTLVRRRARRGLAGLVVGAAAAVTLPMMLNGASVPAGDDGRIDPATVTALANYDAQKMPELIDRHVHAILGSELDALGDPVVTVKDSAGRSLQPRYFDKARSMEVKYGEDGSRQLRVSLMHSRSEAEGDARRICADDLASGYAFSCEVATGPTGDVVTTRVMAMRRISYFPDPEGEWGALTRAELRTGVPAKADPSQDPIDVSEVFFVRSVESVHSETFLTSAEEIVKAPSFEAAQQAFEVPVDDLVRIVTDPELVIPEPSEGGDDCASTLEGDQELADRLDELAEKREPLSRADQLRNCGGTPAPAHGG